jgi:GDP-L-fucose synthase
VTQGREIHVIHLAARVGGLYANMKDKVGFYEDNMSINMNVLKACHKQGVQKIVSALSTCIFPDNYRPEGYPKDQNYEMNEDDIHKGKPHPSNEGYAYAKRMLEMQSRLYNE